MTMYRHLRTIWLFLLLPACVEPYNFIMRDTTPGLVVEAYLSDKSFNETTDYPSDGRNFYVKISYTSDVTNTRPEMVSEANVELIDDTGEKVNYIEQEDIGIYEITDPQFKVISNRKYKLAITLQDERRFESSWEELPETRPIGEVRFSELEKTVYKYEAGEQVVRSVKGIDLHISVPQNETGEPIFYKWDYDFMWVYIAPELSVISPNKKCWIIDPNYLNTYSLRNDNAGNYNQSLFFLETVRNDRVYNDFSALIRQNILSEDHYYFFKEMQDLNQGGLLIDTPPFNLRTNINAVGNDTRVYGHFGIVSEQAVRWYLDKDELSYFIKDTSKEDCNIPFLDQAPQCTNCLLYEYGQATNVEPIWWKK